VGKQLPKNPSDIVWLSTGFIGDVILTTAGTELAAKVFPKARQHVITTPIGVKALAHARGLTSLVAFNKRSKTMLRAFKDVKSGISGSLNPEETIMLQVHRSFRSTLLTKYLGFPTITYYETNFSFLAQEKVARAAIFNESARISLLLEPLGVDRLDIQAAKPYLNADTLRSEIAEILVGQVKSWVLVAPGSVWGTKRWTTEGFTQLTKMILNEGHGVILVGSKAEEEVAAEIFNSIDRTEALKNLVGVTFLEDLPGLFKRCRLLVSNDSSPIHFASAVNLPTVAIFGATIPEMGFGPTADQSSSVGISLECRPCSDHGPMVCPLGHFRCMKELSAEMVFAKVKSLL
jgi:heptosyltransferase-2